MTQLEAELDIKKTLAVSVSRVEFDDLHQCIRVKCDTEHGTIPFQKLTVLADTFNAQVNITAEMFDQEPVVVLLISPTPFFYPKAKV